MANNANIKDVADQQGNVIRISPNNPDWGFVRIQQERGGWNAKGFFNKKSRSHLLKAELTDLNEMDITVDTIYSGNIVIKESFEQFRKEKPEKDLKMAGDTGVICKGVDPETGEVRDIYRTTEYDQTGMVQDVLIPHVNGDEIREANGSSSMEKPLSQSDLKDLSKKKDKVEEKIEEEVEMEEETFEL
jgi:hypothetical protein